VISCRGRIGRQEGRERDPEKKKKKRERKREAQAVPTGAQIEIAFKTSTQVGALARFIMIRSDQAWRETAWRGDHSVA